MEISISVGVLIYLPFHLIVSPFLSHCMPLCISLCPAYLSVQCCSQQYTCSPFVYPCVYLYVPAYLSVQCCSQQYTCSPFVYPCVYLYALHIFLSNAVPNSIPVHRSSTHVYISMPCISFCPMLFPTVYLFTVRLPMCISLCPCISFCPMLFPTVYLFTVRLPMCISLCPCISFCPMLFPTVYLFTVRLPMCISLCPAYLSVQCCSQQYTCSPFVYPCVYLYALHIFLSNAVPNSIPVHRSSTHVYISMPCISFCPMLFPTVYLFTVRLPMCISLCPAYLSVQCCSQQYTCSPVRLPMCISLCPAYLSVQCCSQQYTCSPVRLPMCISLCPCISFCPMLFPTVYLFTRSSTHVYIFMLLHNYLSVQCCSQLYTCSPVRLPCAHPEQLHPAETEWKYDWNEQMNNFTLKWNG